MPQPRVTPEMVSDAAEKLTAQGHYPSAATVREFIGSGSFSTVNKYLQAWREQKETSATTMELPERIEEAFRRAASESWTMANTLASEQVNRMAEQMNGIKKIHETQQAESNQEIERLEKEIEELKAKNREMQIEIGEKRREFELLIREAATANAERESASREANKENARAQRLEDLNRELEKKLAVFESKQVENE